MTSFTGNDVKIILVMTAVTVLLAFVMPALGLAGSEQSTSDIPEFNASQSDFESNAEYPPYPIQADEGRLNVSSNQFDDFRGSQQIELGESTGGNRTFLVAINADEVHLTDVEASTIDDSHTFTSVGETHTLEAYGYEVDLIARDITTGVYDYQIQQRPGASSIPILGGVFDATDDLAKVMWWMLNIMGFYVRTIVEPIVNIGSLTLEIIGYMTDTFVWLLSTYFTFADGAPAWAQIIVYVPGVILFLEFAKLSIVGLQIIRGSS